MFMSSTNVVSKYVLASVQQTHTFFRHFLDILTLSLQMRQNGSLNSGFSVIIQNVAKDLECTDATVTPLNIKCRRDLPALSCPP